MIIFATGISGSGRLNYLEEAAADSGGKLKVVDIGKRMFEKSAELGIRIPDGKILDMDPLALDYLRAVTFEELLKEAELYRGPGSEVDLVISTHVCFRWKKHLTPAFNLYYLNSIDPDIYVTIVDNAQAVRARLEETQWKGRLKLKDIVVWRDEEMFITEILAAYRRKPFYILARREPPRLLLDILYKVEKQRLRGGKPAFKVYLSYPITHVLSNPEHFKMKDAVKEALREVGAIVFDPIAIDEVQITGLAEDAERNKRECVDLEVEGKNLRLDTREILEARSDIIDQTVARDYKLIDQSDAIIVFYPTTSVSPGVLNEIRYGFTHNKDVYAIFPIETRSPFFEYYTTMVFKSHTELIEYLKSSGHLTS
ncbi:MAG: hypothetical protein NZ954_01490 [Thermofilaceae archaeon]|nr:hypothetical protein [Thermofilaceae archaeon]MCX8180455.1 hypothetical protein [Thermofilaceae archaeon]MDW8003348.1 hypothetical protein [Thermofilaceae archaeon]